jgi:hypothetical protein
MPVGLADPVVTAVKNDHIVRRTAAIPVEPRLSLSVKWRNHCSPCKGAVVEGA